jgi:hypothetical protein
MQHSSRLKFVEAGNIKTDSPIERKIVKFWMNLPWDGSLHEVFVNNIATFKCLRA